MSRRIEDTLESLRTRIRGGPEFMAPTTGPLYYWQFQYYNITVSASAVAPTRFFNSSRPCELLRIQSIIDNSFPISIGGSNVGLQTRCLDIISPGQSIILETEAEDEPGSELIDASQFFAISAGGITQELVVTIGFRDQRGGRKT